MKLTAPLLLLLLLMGGAAGVCGRQGKATSLDQFMEEVRGALASHWELLQNLRYHTLGIKVRLVQLEAQIQNLSEHLHAGKGDHDTGESKGRLTGYDLTQKIQLSCFVLLFLWQPFVKPPSTFCVTLANRWGAKCLFWIPR